MISHEDYLEKLVNFGRGVATLEGGSKIQQSALFHRLIAALPNSEERDLITDALESK